MSERKHPLPPPERASFTELLSFGTERSCWTDPRQPSRLLKVSAAEYATETRREIAYFELLKRRGVTASFLPRYFGSFETADVVAFEEERIDDVPGSSAEGGGQVLPIWHWVEGKNQGEIEALREPLCRLKREMLAKNIIVSDLHPGDILYQPETGRLWVIDGYGTPEFLPLPNYVRWPFGWLKIHRQWRKFQRRCPHIPVPD